MSKPFTASVSHRLGQEEATRRLQSGLSTVRERFGQHITLVEETWTGNHLDFHIAVLGQNARGTVNVADDAVHLTVELPFLLNVMANKVKGLIHKQTTLMLEKK